MPTFSDWLQLLAPPWLLDPGGRALLSTIGTQMDRGRDRIRQGVRARFPEVAPSDALPVIAAERLLPRAPGETDASWAAYLRKAWEVWGGDPTLGGGAGTPAGVLTAVARAGFPVTYASSLTGDVGATAIVSWNGRWVQMGTGGTPVFGQLDDCVERPGGGQPGWYDGQESFWSKFWLLLFAPDGMIDGLSNDPGNAQKALLNKTVGDWNRASATFAGTFVIPSPTWESVTPGGFAPFEPQHFLQRLTGPTQYVLGWPPAAIDPNNVIGGSSAKIGGNSVLFIDPT